MGIFSFFGKKNRQKDSPSDDKDMSRPKRKGGGDRDSDRLIENSTPQAFVNSQMLQRDLARETTLKIDAIESAMELDILGPPRTIRTDRPKIAERPREKPAPEATPAKGSEPHPMAFQSTLPMMETSTTETLLGSETAGDLLQPLIFVSETSPVIEEAAILFANEQTDLVEQMLMDAIAEDQLGTATRAVWWMLFDLYQVLGGDQKFESLSIDYASKFETSPPAWRAAGASPMEVAPVKSGTIPSVAFSGVLDSSIARQLERVQKLSAKAQVFKLEFARVTEVDPVGCVLLLGALKTLQKSDRPLILVGALELTGKIRAIVEVGRRDETEAPWLLLMEILQLLNLQQEFEEASIDYCVTFEVSPPAFEPPKGDKITTAAAEAAPIDPLAERFMMPLMVKGPIAQLLAAISDHAAQHLRLIVDCSQLVRIDFTAAGELLNGLVPIIAQGKPIEFHDVNHLVAALLNVMGYGSQIRIIPHKY